MSATEASYTMFLHLILILLILGEAVIIFRLAAGFVKVAQQTGVLKLAGNIACALEASNISYYEGNITYKLELMSGSIEVDWINVKDAPSAVVAYSYDYRMGIPQYSPMVLKIGEKVYQDKDAESYIMLRLFKEFKPVMEVLTPLIDEERSERGNIQVVVKT